MITFESVTKELTEIAKELRKTGIDLPVIAALLQNRFLNIKMESIMIIPGLDNTRFNQLKLMLELLENIFSTVLQPHKK